MQICGGCAEGDQVEQKHKCTHAERCADGNHAGGEPDWAPTFETAGDERRCKGAESKGQRRCEGPIGEAGREGERLIGAERARNREKDHRACQRDKRTRRGKYAPQLAKRRMRGAVFHVSSPQIGTSAADAALTLS